MRQENIKILSLLEELEEVITDASRMPFVEKGIIDIDEATSIINDIKLTLPKDFKDAQWIIQEKDRILDEAKSEYNRIIESAKDHAQYLTENDIVKKEAEKRAQALLTEAENHSRYMKLRAYEYVDKMLYDMQNDIGSIATQYIQPMNNYFAEVINNINGRVNSNRMEMKNMAERIQLSEGADVLPEEPALDEE